jgi:hypothetical protein
MHLPPSCTSAAAAAASGAASAAHLKAHAFQLEGLWPAPPSSSQRPGAALASLNSTFNPNRETAAATAAAGAGSAA